MPQTDVLSDSLPTAPAAAQPWSAATRLAFRICFVWFVLYNLPFPLGRVPYTDEFAAPWQEMWQAVVPWVGRHVLRLENEITILPAGSGDTTWNYVQLLCMAAVTVVLAAVWSALDRRRPHYPRLHDWLRVYVRFPLGMTMIAYGAYKVIKSQFPYPSLTQLAVPYGDSSPMGLLWRFMGYSPAYNLFTGLGELVGGVLLFFRRTTIAGALLLVIVLSNVVILNYAYDVPVKLYSSNLLAMALFLLAPDVRRLFDFLFRNRAVPAAPARRLFRAKVLNLAADGLKLVLLAFALYTTLNQSLQAHRGRELAARPSLYGTWETEEFVRNGVALPPLLTDSVRWRGAIVDRGGIVAVRSMSDVLQVWRLAEDTAARTITLTAPQDSTRRWVLAFERPDPERLVLSGSLAADTVRVTLRYRDPSGALLATRGYRWINERPFNR